MGAFAYLRDAALDLTVGSACLSCRQPGRLLCDGCRAELPRHPVVARPDPEPDGLVPLLAVADWEGPIRELVLSHKEHSAWGLAGVLGELLAIAARPWIAPDAVTVLVPMPSRAAVVQERGHDPLWRITRAAARRLPAGVVARRLLRQVRAPADQAGLSREERLANLSQTMATRTRQVRTLARQGRPVAAVLCDDVVTTGATLREAQRALQQVGVPVLGGAVIAATRRRNRPRPE